MSGDLFFYGPGSLEEEVIARLTGGPYSHVAICAGAGQVIEALRPQGVRQDTAGSPLLTLYASTACRDVTAGLAWLRNTVGKPYSYAAYVDAAEDIVWAALQPHVGVGPISVAVPQVPAGAILQPGAFDCSSLAARFLVIAQYEPLPASLDASPDAASPNSLAWMLGARW